MSNVVKQITCKGCSKRRKPAKRSNGRLSVYCNECAGGLFWATSFGRWFAEATTRQSPDSMPFDESDIKGIYQLWLTRRQAIGYRIKNGEIILNFDYHISHRDPANGQGFQGRFTTANLIVATAYANKSASNIELVDHGHRVYTTKRPFGTAAKVRQWCIGKYKLNALVDELTLEKYSPPSTASDFSIHTIPEGVPPLLVLEQQLERFEEGSTNPWRYTFCKPNDVFTTAIIFGIGLGSGQLKDNPRGLSIDNSNEF